MLLIYLIILLIVFLGLYIGLIIGYMAEEELKPGRKYFLLLRFLIFLAILIIFFVHNRDYVFFISLALLIIIFSFSRHRETLYYYLLAVIFFLSWQFNGFVLLVPLIFLYGFPLGSLYLYNNLNYKKKKKKIILGMLINYAGFLVLGVLFGLLGLVL